MTTDIVFAERPGYLLVEARCPWTLDNARRLIDTTRSEAERRGHQRILIDLRQWSSPDFEMTRFWSGEHLAAVMTGDFKIAAFADLEHVNYFGENTAVNRGAWFAIFPDEAGALDWLLV